MQVLTPWDSLQSVLGWQRPVPPVPEPYLPLEAVRWAGLPLAGWETSWGRAERLQASSEVVGPHCGPVLGLLGNVVPR